ncbi:NAD(P)H-binding protein [Nocardia sp. alder85J]|uniref:NAD(P)H-binding protein n=1 Tax=Nocardia sp. alder85J TaxID=2862949 RepID=UPI001CD3746E|nr:NAD(P)H-binding protein [Nocardia sp. alder85J]MCX4091203.1 NAD(P)H-binding protein [Nocardia sp. alder85J]
MILVTGATGTIGSELIRQLAQRGEQVRALTRNPGAATVPDGVEVVGGDYADRDAVAAAMAGVDAVFLVGVFGPHSNADPGLVAAARAAGVRRAVKLSAIGTGDPELGWIGTWHEPGERALRDSGLEWTVLRPSAFATNSLAWADDIRHGKPVPSRTWTGAQGVVDPQDIAAVAVRALVSDAHTGHTYTLTGPEALSEYDQAAVLGSALGRPVEVVDLTDDEVRARMATAGLPADYIDGVQQGTAFIRDGRNATLTDDVQAVLGRAPRTYTQWVADHLSAFTAN